MLRSRSTGSSCTNIHVGLLLGGNRGDGEDFSIESTGYLSMTLPIDRESAFENIEVSSSKEDGGNNDRFFADTSGTHSLYTSSSHSAKPPMNHLAEMDTAAGTSNWLKLLHVISHGKLPQRRVCLTSARAL